MTTHTTEAPTLPDQAKVLLPHIAGYVGHQVVATGLRSGLIRDLSEAEGVTTDDLAERLGFDPFYVHVWCRGALAAGVLERDGDKYRLAPHMATLLLDETSPAFVGGTFLVLQQPEIFPRFEASLDTFERLWWDECGPEFIKAVSGTGRPFYTRLIPGGLSQVPGLEERLAAGGDILDTACGAGHGLIRLAQTYPASRVVGVDGDAHSIDLARRRVEEASLSDRVELTVSPLEDLSLDRKFALVVNNISMHECRDIDRVAANFKTALEPGGWLVISDFPFPDDDDGLRSVPGRIMSGIQFFEAQIDDQLLPRRAYDELLTRHGFKELGSFEISPMHAVTYGRA